MRAVKKMVDLTKFRQIEWMFIDLTIILVHLCPEMQAETKMADSNISNLLYGGECFTEN